VIIKQSIKEHLNCINAILSSEDCISSIEESINVIVSTYKDKGKVLFCGNGGSAADSEHLAAELSGRFKIDRKPLNADALHNSGSALTAISNDYSYADVYARLLEARGYAGDILIAISTSGQSPNVNKAIAKAKELSMKIITISGNRTADFHKFSDVSIIIPSADTARIQEAYMLIGHIICEQVEKKLFS
jgi:D-sedoheptulose 7-phosphate isomerase